jgi:dTDP-4-amino-4,6-dideoxygalactose transaminase
MRVPLLDLSAQFARIRPDVLRAIEAVCDSQRFILGPAVEEFERAIAARLGVAHAIGMSSGTDALLAALMAAGVGAGDEVITPTYSFFATAGCVWRLGARPVLVDVDPATLNVTGDAVAAAMTPNTKAVIPVHLYGQMVDMPPIMAAAARQGAVVIEDACQAIDAADGGARAGAVGAMSAFSFFPSKNLGGFGDGGLATTNDDALARELRLLRGHGAATRYHHEIVGGNFRLDALQAAVLTAKLPHLEAWTAGRRANAARYRALFAESASTAGVAVAAPMAGPTPEGVLSLPVERPGVTHVYNQFVVRLGRRDAVKAHLTEAGVGCEVYYPVPFHLQACFAPLGYPRGAFPIAEAAAGDSLALPIYPELTEAQQRYVVDAVLAGMTRTSAVAPAGRPA